MRGLHTFELVEWQAAPSGEPRFIAAELDGERWEVRKLELFPDGTAAHFADSHDLAELPWPQLSKIARDASFMPVTLTAGEFEQLWTQPSIELCLAALAGRGDV